MWWCIEMDKYEVWIFSFCINDITLACDEFQLRQLARISNSTVLWCDLWRHMMRPLNKIWRGSKFKWCTPYSKFGSPPMKTFNAMRFCTLTVFEPPWQRYEIEKVYLDGLPEDGDLTGQMVVLHLQSFQVSFHLRRQRSDATFLSLKEKMNDFIFLTSGLVWLAWVFAFTTSSSSWRTSIACFCEKRRISKTEKSIDKMFQEYFLLSFVFVFVFLQLLDQPGLLLSRDNSINGHIALQLFNCLCLQWQPLVVSSFIYPKSVLLDSFCAANYYATRGLECIQDPTSPPLD